MAGEMAKWIRVFVTKPDLNPIPGSHTVEGESQLLKVVLRSPHEEKKCLKIFLKEKYV